MSDLPTQSATHFQPWDSDHTALVHVLWEARRRALIPLDTDCDALASLIMQSQWMQAVRLHAKAVRAAPNTTRVPLPED